MNPERIAQYKVGWVKRAIAESIKDLQFRSLVETKFHNVPKENIIGKLWDWQSKFLFVQEPRGKDYVKHAIEFVRDAQGDCEDFVVFNASVLKLLGIPVRIRVTDTKGKGYYTHITIQYKPGAFRPWITFDGTYRKQGCGGEPPVFRKQRSFRI
jgi:hypothetical protein